MKLLQTQLSAQFCALVCTCSCGTTTTTTSSTTSTTTTTTTLVVVYDNYTANVYDCADCAGGPGPGTVTVALPVGTSVTVGQFYQASTPDGSTYELTSVATVPGPGLILNAGSVTMSCTLSCIPPP